MSRICPLCDLPPDSRCAFANCKREWAERRPANGSAEGAEQEGVKANDGAEAPQHDHPPGVLNYGGWSSTGAGGNEG